VTEIAILVAKLRIIREPTKILANKSKNKCKNSPQLHIYYRFTQLKAAQGIGRKEMVHGKLKGIVERM